MNDWQMKEYDELRLEKIEDEHIKYLNSRVNYVVEKLYFENPVEQPTLDGYNHNAYICVTGNKNVEGEVVYTSSGYECQETLDDFEFPIQWLTMKESDVYDEIVRIQIQEYQDKIEVKKKQDSLRKEREIKELEEKLKKLKGENKC